MIESDVGEIEKMKTDRERRKRKGGKRRKKEEIQG